MKKYGYIVLRSNGDMELHQSKQAEFELEELQEAVGGHIQIVQGRVSEMLMVIDDEGKLKGKPINRRATILYAPEYDFIVGDAIIGTSYNEDPYAEPDVYKMPWDLALRFYGVIQGF